MMYPMHGGGGSGMFFYSILYTVFLIVALAGIVLVIVGLVRPGRESAGSGGPAALEGLAELNKRYARGEINREEYLRVKEDLSK